MQDKERKEARMRGLKAIQVRQQERERARAADIKNFKAQRWDMVWYLSSSYTRYT